MVQLCTQQRLFEELIYIQEKRGQRKEVIHILLNQIDNVEESIKFVVRNYAEDQELWKDIVEKSIHNTHSLCVLIKHMEFYEHPHILIRALKKDCEMREAREALMRGFENLRLTLAINTVAYSMLREERYALYEEQLKSNLRGVSIVNECQHCKAILIEEEPKKRSLWE